MQKSAQIMGIVLVVLLFISGLILRALLHEKNSVLTVSFLNIGQGDAIFIESPSGRQVLIDAGKNRAVVRELAKRMPWYDRTLDMVIATHPDADHIGGIPDILSRYRVGLILESSVKDEGGADSVALEKAIVNETNEGAERMMATRGQRIDLGEGVYLNILFPDRSVPRIETNTGAIDAQLVYGETSFMLTSDSPKAVEDYLVRLDGKNLKSNILKAGHHGSRTSSSMLFVGFVSPEYAIYSRGCDNTYGHPHDEVKETYAKLNISTLDTCENGTITFVSDGQKVRLK